MPELKHPYPVCEKDGFPQVKLNGQLQCVAEYIAQCVGQRKD